MILRRLGIFLVIVFLGIGAGIFIIDMASKQFGLTRPLTNLIMVVYIGIFIVLSLVLGKDIPKESSDAEVPLPSEQKRGTGKQYAWFVPFGTENKAGFPITRKLHIIGRDIHADIFINEETVSKKHAQVMNVSGSYVLKDLDSRNGTFINNQRISESYMNDGDLVTFGEAKYIFACPKAGALPTDAEGEFVPDLDLDVDLEEYSTRLGTGTRAGTGSRLRDLSRDRSKSSRRPDAGDRTYAPGSDESDDYRIDDDDFGGGGGDDDNDGNPGPGTGTRPMSR